jgi:hypothetical protein
VGACDNGAGGYFDCDNTMSNTQIAQAACLSVYDSCDTSSCGYFYYWHTTDTDQAWSCDCNVPVGQYEFIYQNEGYSQVGQDYGGQTTDVSYNDLFVRVKNSAGCNGDSWALALADLGAGAENYDGSGQYQSCSNGAGGGFECSSSMSYSEIAQAACLSVY